MWYSSYRSWELRKKIPFPNYEIRYATSSDGINWKFKNKKVLGSKKFEAVARPYVIKNKIELNDLLEEKLIFKGSATEGAKAFPANVNVAAAVGLAGIGADKTELEIWADPNLTRNTHKVIVDSDSAMFEICLLYTSPSPRDRG